MQKALIVKLGAIGDVIMTIPAVYKLHQSGTQIDWICGAAARPILEQYPWINIIPADDRAILKGGAAARLRGFLSLWHRLAGRRYDLCATLYYDRRYRIITLPVIARKRIQLSHHSRNFSLLTGRHHTDEYARILLGLPDSVRPSSLPPLPFPASNAAQPPSAPVRIALVPGGANNTLRQQTLRVWPVQQYARLARLLVERGVEVVLLGGPEDTWVRQHFAEVPVVDHIGVFTLPQVVEECDRCHAVVSHDTGPLHLAGLTSTPLIGLFGPTDPHGRLPRREYATAVWGGTGFACTPCYDGRNFAPCQNNGCMQQITPEMILNEIDRLLRRKSESASTPFRIVCAPWEEA